MADNNMNLSVFFISDVAFKAETKAKVENNNFNVSDAFLAAYK